MEGIDVHGDKGAIGWGQLKAAGVSFAFVKASEGYTFRDARLYENLAGARAAGIKVGPYHYARPDLHPGTEGATQEAVGFCATIQSRGWRRSTDLKPVLDFEEAGSGNMAHWALAFCQEVERQLGVKPVIYTYTYFVRRYLRSAPGGAMLTQYPLWLANYGRNDGTRHAIDKGEFPWPEWQAHQYTSNGSLPGVGGRVDRNYAPSLEPFLATKPAPQPKPDTSSKGMWSWIRWWRGRDEFAEVGPRHKPSRPNVPKRIPLLWWARLYLNKNGRTS